MEKKFTIFFLGWLFLPLITQAQFFKGQMALGGNMSFDHVNSVGQERIRELFYGDNLPLFAYTTEDVNLTTFKLQPKWSYALSDKWMLGVALGLQITKTSILVDNYYELTDDNTVESVTKEIQYTEKQYSFTPSLRYVHMFGKHFGVWSEAFWSVGIENAKKSTFTTVGFRPGILLFMSEHLGVEANIGLLGYHYQKDKSSIGTTVHKDFSLSWDISTFDVGIQYYFGKTSQ